MEYTTDMSTYMCFLVIRCMCAGHASRCSASTVTSSCMRLFIHVLAVPPIQPYHNTPTLEYDTNLCNQSDLRYIHWRAHCFTHSGFGKIP